MVLAGIFLLISAFLCALSIILKFIQQKKLNYTIILFQGIFSISIFLWSLCYCIILIFFESEHIIQNLGLVVFLNIVFSYLITFAVSFLLTMALIQKLCVYYRAQTDTHINYGQWYEKLTRIHIPLGILCFIIGVWDIIYITSLHSLIINIQSSFVALPKA